MKTATSRLLQVDVAALERTGLSASATSTSHAIEPKKDAPLLQAVPVGAFDARLQTRAGRLALVKDHRQQLAELAHELRDVGGDSKRRAELFRGLTELQGELQQLQAALADQFVPQHSQRQLISPQDLLVSRLFNVRNKVVQRERLVQFDLIASAVRVK